MQAHSKSQPRLSCSRFAIWRVLTSVEDKKIVDDALFAISFATTENDKVLAELCRRVAVSGGGRGPIKLLLTSSRGCLHNLSLSSVVCLLLIILHESDTKFAYCLANDASREREIATYLLPGVDLNHIPAEFDHFVGLMRQTIALFSLHTWLTRNE